MIKIIKQDLINGEVFDTTVKVEYEITVAGEQYEEFKTELQDLINKYRI